MAKITFIAADGDQRWQVEARCNLTLLDVAHEHGIDIEGACEGAMACSTCHVIVAAEDFPRLPPADEDEEDMLDLASDLQATSRLACQITITEALDGLTVHLPRESRNFLLV